MGDNPKKIRYPVTTLPSVGGDHDRITWVWPTTRATTFEGDDGGVGSGPMMPMLENSDTFPAKSNDATAYVSCAAFVNPESRNVWEAVTATAKVPLRRT